MGFIKIDTNVLYIDNESINKDQGQGHPSRKNRERRAA